MFKLRFITQKLIASKKLIKNRFKGSVLFEKFEPNKRQLFSCATITSGSVAIGSNITITASNRTVIGNGASKSGGYDIGGDGGFILLLSKKPNLFHRNMVKLIFGWKYFDSKNI